MSCKGGCWDNAVRERFVLDRTLEREWQRDYVITDYLVNLYTAIRLHSQLGYR